MPLRNLSIKRKVMVITMVVSGAALLVACTAFIFFEQANARKQMAQTLGITAAMTAANSTAGLSFDEAGSVEQALKSLSAQPDIVQACVYNKSGKPFAQYRRNDLKPNLPLPPLEDDGRHFEHQRLELFQPINLAGETIGTIYLEQDLSELNKRLWSYLLTGVLVMLACAALALLLSARLQMVISGPLAGLARTVAVVRANKNYSVRATRQGNDDLGSLIDGFNEMLAQIQERDTNLERRVDERTQALARSERAVVESRNFLDQIINSISDPIFVKNRKHQGVLVNDAFCQLTACQREDLLGKSDHDHDFFSVAEADEFRSKEELVFNTGRENINEEKFTAKDGTVRYLITKKTLYTDEKGGKFIVGVIRDITDRQRAEAIVRESQARFKFIFDAVPVGIASHLVRPDGRVAREVNRAHLRISGLTREQHDEPGIYAQLTHPADSARQDEFMRQVHEGKIDQFSLVKRYLRLDGTMVWVAFSYQRQNYADGGREELTTLVDITESKRAEEALRESEASYYSLVDQMPAGIFRKDKAGRYVFVNSWFCRLKGVKPENFLGKLPEEVTPATEDAVEPGTESTFLAIAGTEHHATILRTGRQIEFDEKSTAPDGKVTYFHAVKSPVFDSDGAIVGSQGILLDVTQRTLAETELAYERDLLEALLDQSPDSIFFKDRQSKYVKLSRSEIENLFRIALERGTTSILADGLPPHLASLEKFHEFIIGKSDADIYGPARAREFGEDEQEIMRTGKSMLGKIEKTVGQDGQGLWFLTTKTPWHNKDGEIIGTFGTSRDITDLKLAEAQVQQAQRQLLETSRLAGMAEVATSVLHNVGNVLNSVNVSTTLVLDLVKKSRLNNLGRLAALVHEQRHNLAAFFTTDPRGIQLPGYLTKLAEHLATEQAGLVSETEQTRKNIEHIKDIVTMQQTYAKVAGVTEKVKVTDLVEDALRMNAGALTRHGVEVVREYPAEPVECNVDRQKVLQILINLIRNAKYACDESKRADKRLKMQIRSSEGRVQISTADNGVGIPAENMIRIFSHGFTTRPTGHGFGLHSGALAAKELGGSLTAHSAGPGAGTQFVLELPLQPPS